VLNALLRNQNKLVFSSLIRQPEKEKENVKVVVAFARAHCSSNDNK
jgi:hypothetical protein